MPDAPALDPRHTALLVMDYQNGIVARLSDAESPLERVSSAVGNVRGRGGRIGWVRVAFTEADLAAIPERSVFAEVTGGRRQPALHADAPDTQIHARLNPQPGDISVRKTRIGAFSTTGLDHQLRAGEITTLVLAGISTSGVVLTTVREAIDLDYQIVVLRDACADRDQDTHAFLTEKLFAANTFVTTVAELDRLWV
ncbi:cysteine hydrolase family protein [Mycobacterium sp. AT1]|uniref:cysteine hydrolase family protein n=1 Tax=Mycobacterium sp. AT1 TaxID=1961706 RepID=UPI0009AC6805|nr:cysteine hydrolase [Mycobacterium sp. AT1]OPX10685.1 isochorismatase [Mycobacterium sp. AT1]